MKELQAEIDALSKFIGTMEYFELKLSDRNKLKERLKNLNKSCRKMTIGQMISNLQHYLKENHNPHTELVITESSYDIKVTTLHSNLSVYDDE